MICTNCTCFSGAFSEHGPFQVDDSAHELAMREYHVNYAEADEEGTGEEEETMIGINADDGQDEVVVVVGALEAKTNLMGGGDLLLSIPVRTVDGW